MVQKVQYVLNKRQMTVWGNNISMFDTTSYKEGCVGYLFTIEL